jgi:predicted DNA-binding protein (MmcQ/YjbR family)
MVLTTGCWVYGNGKTYGYVTTVENGFFWDKVYIRPDLQSSVDDCYIVRKSNEQIFDQLRQMAEAKERVELNYKRHWVTLSSDCYSDEITQVIPVKG